MQEPGGGNMVTYPRQLEGVVRKQDGGRRATREARAQRKATEAVQEEQQVKRMKSAKRREIDDRQGVQVSDDLHIEPFCKPQ